MSNIYEDLSEFIKLDTYRTGCRNDAKSVNGVQYFVEIVFTIFKGSLIRSQE